MQSALAWSPEATDEAGLLNELRICLSLSIENVIKAACIVRRFDELRISTARLEEAVPPQILRSLRLIAHGKLIPEVFIRLNGKVQSMVSMLPVDTQKELLSGKPLVVLDGDHVVQLPVHELSPRQASQVFRSDFTKVYIRTPEEQQEFLKKSSRTVKSQPVKGKAALVRPSREQDIEEWVVEPKDGCVNELIRYYSDKLLGVLNKSPEIDPDASLALKMVHARIARSVNLSPVGEASTGVVSKIIRYLDVNGPSPIASVAEAVGISVAELTESVSANRRRFSTNGRELALVNQRV